MGLRLGAQGTSGGRPGGAGQREQGSESGRVVRSLWAGKVG